MKWFTVGLLATLVNAAVEKIVRPPTQPVGGGSKLLTFNEAQDGELYAGTSSFNWVKAPGREGYYLTTVNGALVERDIVTQNERVLITADKLPKGARNFWFNADATQILWAVNAIKQYRYSYFANYLVQDVATGTVKPLIEGQNRDIAYAAWSPSATDNVIAFVRGNNVYIWKDGQVTQITTNGSPDMFNGVPDWVYEEEILGTNYALWFNEEGDKLVYLSTDETGVPTFTVQYHMNNTNPPASEILSYPRELDIRYPKVGATNPTIKASLLDLKWGSGGPAPVSLPVSGFDAKELIIGEVAWLGKQIAIKVYNRVQNLSKLWVYDTASGDSEITRSQEGTDGWLDNNMAIEYLGDGTYIDKNDLSGYDHLYLESVQPGASAKALTQGEYEVRSILHTDATRKTVYFTSTEVHPTESHLFAVNLATGTKTNLTDTSNPGFYSASFTPGGNYYVLSYLGPNVPYQQLYAANNTMTPIRTITSNDALVEQLKGYNLPKIEFVDLESPTGFTLSGMWRYPVNFDPSKKYPVLFTPYGGPGAQEVTKRMQGFDFNSYISSDPEMEYLTFTLDGRGTGLRGRAHRAAVNRNLGIFEAEDQIWAARELAKKYSFIDADKIQIWGWSFGGYLSAKVVEADSGVFSQAIITAPVTDWRLYDSMYTERYMGLPSTNAANYTSTAIRKVDGFKNIAGGVLLQHGTGDDNVHFQNSEVLVDILVGGGVGPNKLAVQYFTDSDHSINYNGANRFVYQQLAGRLYSEKIRKVGANETHQWDRRDADYTASTYVETGEEEEERYYKTARFVASLEQQAGVSARGRGAAKDSRMLLPGQKASPYAELPFASEAEMKSAQLMRREAMPKPPVHVRRTMRQRRGQHSRRRVDARK